ncbi:hypothetical protein PG996_004367 [Apiospora saccharicola]|uniref:Uncharacterized protein n=1 Tax=Apiospora saccharicola TaxID=335842 RepID=A0ABR1W3Z6_9PEZI
MAGPTTTKKGANPAPEYQSTFNSIELLQASVMRKALLSASDSHSKVRAAQQQQPITTTVKTSAKPTSAAKTAALLAQAKAEEADLDRLAMDDDNAGVGLHGLGTGKTAEQLNRMREDRKLATRIMGKKRRAEEARGQRMRGEEPSSDDEPGRSGVGRAKKRVRTAPAAVVVEKTTGANGGDDMDTDMKDEGEAAAAAAATEKTRKTPGESSGEDKEADGDDHENETEETGAATPGGDQQKAIDGSNPDAEAQSKKKRKKKNKKKTKGAAAATAPPSDD